MNHEEQYSIWPADRELPLGWSKAGKSGLKPEVLAWIEEVWTDMRPSAPQEDGRGRRAAGRRRRRGITPRRPLRPRERVPQAAGRSVSLVPFARTRATGARGTSSRRRHPEPRPVECRTSNRRGRRPTPLATIGVVGAGIMGVGVAQNLAQTGHRVVLLDLAGDVLDRARAEIERNLRFTASSPAEGAAEPAGGDAGPHHLHHDYERLLGRRLRRRERHREVA